MVRKIKLSLMGVFAAVLLAGAPALAVPSNEGDDNPHDQVTICHATGSQNNPFVEITVNANGTVSGHAGNSHQNGNDIIPPFDYNDNGTVKSFPGQNWDAEGQLIYNNDCQAGGQGGGTTPTNPPTQTQSQSQTTNVTTQVAGRGGAAPTQAPQAVAPQGGVAAGDGGAKTRNTAAVVGLVGSLGAIASGLVLTRKFF